MIRFRALLVGFLIFLTACGGGGDSSTDSPIGDGAQVAMPLGARFSSTTDGTELYVLENGSFYLLHLGFGGNGDYLAYGTGTTEGAKFAGTGTMFIFAGDLYTSPTVLSATFTPPSSLSATRTVGDSQPRPVSYVQVSSFASPALQSEVTGSYVNLADLPSMTVDAQGNLEINNGMIAPCRITGTIRPHSNVRLYDAELNFSASAQCAASQKKGIAILTGSSLLFVMQDGYYLPLKKI